MNLLLVEDNQKSTATLVNILKRNSYVVDVAVDAKVAMNMAATGIYDIILLERMLSGCDIISFVQEFRNLGFDTLVMILSIKDSFQDVVESLDAGADDYLIKPFQIDELLARLRALSRRKEKYLVGETISAAGLLLDKKKSAVIMGTEVISLSYKELLILELLIRNCGQVLTKELIYEKVWGYNANNKLNCIETYIYFLRKKLKGINISTIRGTGYLLQEDACN
ncbi:MAG: two component transcriptional regulator, winged helix family [Firmicutes bacterium]|nr:two component transcriptional regulator, winged helix family [Bacillota bacterium]